MERIGWTLEQRRQEEPPEEKLPALSMQELEEQVGKALDELENFRSRECAGIVAEALRHEMPQDLSDSLREIRGQLKLFEDDNAEMLLNQLLSCLKMKEDQE